MAFTVSIELNREIELSASYDEAFELLSDVPRSVSHFPKLHELVDLGENRYRWEMEKIGVDKYSIQTAYACKYESDRNAGKITWVPVPGEGNGIVSGSWTLTSVDEHTTRARFQTSAELSLPLPGLLKLAISPVVKHEFNALVDTYMSNLKKVF